MLPKMLLSCLATILLLAPSVSALTAVAPLARGGFEWRTPAGP